MHMHNMCQMFLAHLWWLQNVGCILLVGAWTVLPVFSRGCCGFELLGCQLCPSYGCCSCCSIQAVIHPGGTGSSGRWHSRWQSENLEKYFDILPKCPSSFTRALASNGEGDLITALQLQEKGLSQDASDVRISSSPHFLPTQRPYCN